MGRKVGNRTEKLTTRKRSMHMPPLVSASPVRVLCFWRDSPKWARTSSFTRCLDHTQRHTTVSRTPLDKCLPRRRDLYLTKQNTHNRRISMPLVGFEPTISAGERPQAYALDRAATGTGSPVRSPPNILTDLLASLYS